METIDTTHNLGKGHSVDLSHLAPVVLYDASDGVVPGDGQFCKGGRVTKLGLRRPLETSTLEIF